MNNSTEYNEQQFKMGIFNSFIEMQINNHYSFHINNYFLQFLTIAIVHRRALASGQSQAYKAGEHLATRSLLKHNSMW